MLEITTSYVGSDGKPLSTTQFLEFLIGTLGKYYDDETKLRRLWSNPETRKGFLVELANDGIDEENLKDLKRIFESPKSDIYDILAHLSFNADIKTRNERAMNVKNSEFMKQFQKDKAIKLIEFLLDKYQERGINEFEEDKFASLIELSNLGRVGEVAKDFGGIPRLKKAYWHYKERFIGGEFICFVYRDALKSQNPNRYNLLKRKIPKDFDVIMNF